MCWACGWCGACCERHPAGYLDRGKRVIQRLCWIPLLIAAVGGSACGWEPIPRQRDGLFRFAVFGDGPYSGREIGRFRRVVDALNARDLAFVIHVGDILWYPCSDAAFRDRRASMNLIRHPVIYTPGDNEWTDCHERIAGGYDPLERLASLRRTFFVFPESSLGGDTIALESQTRDSVYSEFSENARWVHAGVVFATLHVVGSGNGTAPFPGRQPAHDAEVARRTSAAVLWLRDAFTAARTTDARAVVLALHAEMFPESPNSPFAPILAAVQEEALAFGKPVLVVHGDNHEYTFDRPLPNVQRLQTFGAPDIGWVDVVVDTTLETLFRVEPNVTPRWMWW